MNYMGWPVLDPISDVEKSLVTYSRGFRYTLHPVVSPDEEHLFHIHKNDELMAAILVDQGIVCDFTVTHDLIAVATKSPAALHLLKNTVGSHVISLKIPLEPAGGDAVGNISIGNYGGNLLVLWHGKDDIAGPVFVATISGRDAFRFSYKPLVYYEYGYQRIFVREPMETVFAIPNMPGQYGAIAMMKPGGLRFFSLKPYFIVNKFTDYYIDNMLFAHHGEPLTTVTRMKYFNGWTMGVTINNNHMTMKYAPDDLVKEIDTDWIKIEVDGVPVLPTDTLALKPAGSNYQLKVTALHELEDLTFHADLPITIRRSEEEPHQAVSEFTIPSLLKGQSAELRLEPMQFLTPWSLARFIEKMNIKIRAEVYETF